MGLALGALALFRQKFNRENRVSRWLASRSFAVYFIHAPMLVWLTIQFQPLQAPPLIKIALLSASGLVLSLLLAEGLKRFWITRNIF